MENQAPDRAFRIGQRRNANALFNAPPVLTLALVVLLAFMDAGLLGIAGVFMIALFAGRLHRWGVNYGVMFMTLYAAPWLVTNMVIG